MVSIKVDAKDSIRTGAMLTQFQAEVDSKQLLVGECLQVVKTLYAGIAHEDLRLAEFFRAELEKHKDKVFTRDNTVAIEVCPNGRE